jgi:photosystem II PsbZ protein
VYRSVHLLLSWENETMVILFQLALLLLVVMSFVMIVGVPVLYASNGDRVQSNRLILLGGLVWTAMVILVGTLNYFVA